MNWINLVPSEIFLLIVSSFITYLTTKRKYKAESKNLEHDITNSIFTTYKSELTSMQHRVDEYIKRIDSLENIVAEQKKEIFSLRGKITDLEKNNVKKKTSKAIKNDA